MFKITGPKNAKVTKVTKTPNFKTGIPWMRCEIATTTKRGEEFIDSLWDASFAPSMREKAATLKPRDRIVINSAQLTNQLGKPDEEGNRKKYLDLFIWDFDLATPKTKVDVDPMDGDDALPF